MACALMALRAQCEILSAEGNIRIVAIEKFFTGVRKTDLKKNEILRSIIVPKEVNSNHTYSDFIKIGTRSSMECAIVSLAYHLEADQNNEIVQCGIAIGSAAPTIKFCKSACEYLMGKIFNKMTDKESEEFASLILEYASPISDIRASAWYRKQVLFNIAKGIFENKD
jgi:CO/xanthine dehydrogenase FAD-binding subunit